MPRKPAPKPTLKNSISGVLQMTLICLLFYGVWLYWKHEPAISFDSRDNSFHVTWGWANSVPDGVEVHTFGGINTPRARAAGVKPAGTETPADRAKQAQKEKKRNPNAK